MKITKHTERIYHYDEFEIENHPDEIIHFRRNRNSNFNQWEYFDKFEQVWTSVYYRGEIDDLENLYQDWLYIEMLNLGMPDKLKIK